VSALLVLEFCACAYSEAFQQTRRPDIGFEPTPYTVVDAMLALAHVGPGDVVYDLGSGDGRIVITAAQAHGARGVGIELQHGLVESSRTAASRAGVADKVDFIEGDFFDADLSAATVVMLYLWPGVNGRLETKFRSELRPGTKIVSYTFPINNWVPDETVQLENGRQLFLWTVPRRPVREPDTPFEPTPQNVVEQMLRLARVGPADVVYDLGSGDGRIVIVAALEYGARGVGVEIVPSLVETSRRVAGQAGLADRATFIEGDLFKVDFSAATVVTLALSADINAKLESKLRRLRPGTRIVSRQFPIGKWKPDQTVRAEDGTTLFLWTASSGGHER
jgi:predicted RNA methylase